MPASGAARKKKTKAAEAVRQKGCCPGSSCEIIWRAAGWRTVHLKGPTMPGARGRTANSGKASTARRKSVVPRARMKAFEHRAKRLDSKDRYPTHPTRWRRTVVQSGAAGKRKMNCNSTLGQKSEFLMGPSAEQRSPVRPAPGGVKVLVFHGLPQLSHRLSSPGGILPLASRAPGRQS